MSYQRDKVIATAELFVARGKILDAIAEYSKLLHDNPNDVNTLNRIGDLHVRINQNKQATDAFTRIANHYKLDGFFLKAIAIYKKINKLDPANLSVYEELAALFAMQGLAHEAQTQLKLLADYHATHGEPGEADRLRRAAESLIPKKQEPQPEIQPALAPEAVLDAPVVSTGDTEAAVQVVRTTNDVVVFLCHAHQDKPAVRELYARLQSDRFQPWLDEEDLIPGQDWEREIPRAVRRSHVVVVCLSPHSINKSGYLQKEIKFALDVLDEQPEGMIFIIPARLEPCDVPASLSRFHFADLFSPRGYDKLKRALELRASQLGFR
jgi:tetratricopeptide (TPR) repeat protein